MKKRWVKVLALLAALTLVATACSQEDDAETTTEAAAETTTTAAPAETTTTAAPTETTEAATETTPPGFTFAVGVTVRQFRMRRSVPALPSPVRS